MHYLNEPTAIVLNGSVKGFRVDSLGDLCIEDGLVVGDTVFALIASYQEWGGTFGEPTNETVVVGITKDMAKAQELERHLENFSGVKPFGYGHNDGHMPWHGYGCGLNSIRIQILPVV